MPEYEIKTGIDGHQYAVFKDEYDANLREMEFIGCRRACFGAFDNAYELKQAETQG